MRSQNGFYLKKLIIVLYEAEYADLFHDISDELEHRGIEVLLLDRKGEVIFSTKEYINSRENNNLEKCGSKARTKHGSDASGECEDSSTDERKGRNKNEEAVDRPEEYGGRGILANEILWITDNNEMTAYLLERSLNVLIYLHDKNQDMIFEGGRYAFEDPKGLTLRYLDRIYRRFRNIPWEILETDRCYVRETTEQDVDAFYELYSDPEITEYMENLYTDPEEEKAYIREYIEKVYGLYEFGIWTVLEKESGKIIGRAGLSYREGFDDAELGFVIGVEWQRRGYAYEVCGAILEYAGAELGFQRVQALVRPENMPSYRLCEKLGFSRECELEMEGQTYMKMVRGAAD